MNIGMLQSRIDDFKKHDEGKTPVTLRENIEHAYAKLVLAKLNQIFANAPADTEERAQYFTDAFKSFLIENWTRINGTLLSYTALPNSEVTDLLVTIAVEIAQEGESPLQLLMPTLLLESLEPGTYPNLNEVVDPLKIKAILQTHILGHEGRYLLPIKLLAEELTLSAKKNPLNNPYFDFIAHPPETTIVNSEEFDRLVGHNSLTQALIDRQQIYEDLASDSSSLLGQLRQLIHKLGIHGASGLGEEANASGGAYPAIIAFMNYYAQLEPCDLQISETIPTIEDLPEGQMMGYVLVRPNKEETALYFINRYDANNPVKKITNNQQYLRYGLDLVTVDNETDIEKLKPELSTQHPTLIRIKGENNAYRLYGYTENQQWALTTLDAITIEAIAINFPDKKRIFHLPLGRVPQTIYDDIAIHKAHCTQSLATYLYQLSNTATKHLHAPIENCSLLQLDEIKQLTDHNFFAEQNRIPSPLQSEINQLFELVQDSIKNFNATENFQTCISRCRDNLLEDMKEQDSILSAIALSKDTKEALISEAQNQFDLAQKKLNEGMKEEQLNTLEGYDHLGLSLKLLNELKVAFNIHSLEELHSVFKPLSAEEIQSICIDPDIQEEIIAQIQIIDDLAIFLLELSAKKMKSFLEASQLLKHYIIDEYDLHQLLQIFDVEKSKIIIDVVFKSQKILPPLVTTANRFKTLVDSSTQKITPEQFTLILQAWDISISPVGSLNDLKLIKTLAQSTTPEQFTLILQALDVQVSSVQEMLQWMEILPDSKKETFYLQHTDIIKRVSDRAAKHCKYLEEPSNQEIFVRFMAMLPEQHKTDFFKKNISLIKEPSCVHEILKEMPEVCRTMYLQEIMPWILSTMRGMDNHSGQFFGQILEYLTPEQRTVAFQSIKKTLISALKEGWKYKYEGMLLFDLNFLEYLTKEQCIELLKALETTRFSSSHSTPKKLGKILHYHSEEKCRTICETWGKSIIKTLKSAQDVVLLFKNTSTDEGEWRLNPADRKLRPELCPVLYDIFKDTIASTLQTTDEYNQLKEYLTPEEHIDLSHRITLYKLKAHLPQERLKTLESVLTENKEDKIKTAFHALFQRQYNMKLFFSSAEKKDADLNLVFQIIAAAETGWLQKINSALSLNLTDKQLADQYTVEAALKNYVTASTNVNQSPRI